MPRTVLFLSIMLFVSGGFIFAQKGTGKLYRIDRYESIYLPLGKISFADKLIEYKVCSALDPDKENELELERQTGAGDCAY